MASSRAVLFRSRNGAVVDSVECDIGPPKMCVSHAATHSKNGLMTMLAEAFPVDHLFAVAHSARTNGKDKRYNKEGIRTAKTF